MSGNVSGWHDGDGGELLAPSGLRPGWCYTPYSDRTPHHRITWPKMAVGLRLSKAGLVAVHLQVCKQGPRTEVPSCQ